MQRRIFMPPFPLDGPLPFRIDGRVVIRGSEGSVFHHVQMYPSERLRIRLPLCWIYIPIQSNSNTFISIGKAVDEVDIHQLGVRVTIHIHCTLSMSEMRKPPVPTLQARVQRYLLYFAHSLLCNYGSLRCFLPPLQVCTRHLETPCMRYLSNKPSKLFQ
ncbi:hypothetical protein TNCV_78011 [Trichonephila clavipes]|nr:hypothetical protein TNCV_78011 [Trichonephila clavipes]